MAEKRDKKDKSWNVESFRQALETVIKDGELGACTREWK